tara:strand:- start:516 stop:698 length:183 start_codon:yes stop_codon:yes gene_type:complete
MNEKREFVTYVRVEDFTNVLYADMGVTATLFLLSIFWKDQRLLMFVGFCLYGFFTLMWHY